jgi:hypothetical protein
MFGEKRAGRIERSAVIQYGKRTMESADTDCIRWSAEGV